MSSCLPVRADKRPTEQVAKQLCPYSLLFKFNVRQNTAVSLDLVLTFALRAISHLCAFIRLQELTFNNTTITWMK